VDDAAGGDGIHDGVLFLIFLGMDGNDDDGDDGGKRCVFYGAAK
jgi:hypothetical protein